MAARRVDAAERQLRRAERIAPDSADIDIALAYVDLFQGRKVDAAMRTSRLLRKHPEREDVISLAKSFERKTTPPTSTNVRPAGLRLVTFDGSLPGTQDQRRARSKRTYALSYRLQPS